MGSTRGQLSDELVALVQLVAPSVVALAGSGQDFSSSGSGFLLDDQGHVVTNFHVIDGLDEPLDAGLHHGARCKATVVGRDQLTDLALLRLDMTVTDHLVLREEPARLGELCLGIGSPFGMYPESVAMGVVSGLARSIPQPNRRPIENAIQTAVAINPGNSGGPLIDVRGQVIGVNQSIDTRGTGIGFAIPAQTARLVVRELLAFGRVDRAALGVTVIRQTVEVNGQPVTGLGVTRTSEPSGDDRLKVGDVILRLGGEVVDEPSDLYRILTRELIEKPTNCQVFREGAVRELTLTPTRMGGPAT